jgi:hypothetical protein
MTISDYDGVIVLMRQTPGISLRDADSDYGQEKCHQAQREHGQYLRIFVHVFLLFLVIQNTYSLIWTQLPMHVCLAIIEQRVASTAILHSFFA